MLKITLKMENIPETQSFLTRASAFLNGCPEIHMCRPTDYFLVFFVTNCVVFV